MKSEKKIQPISLFKSISTAKRCEGRGRKRRRNDGFPIRPRSCRFCPVAKKGSTVDQRKSMDIEGNIMVNCAFCGGTGTDPFGLLSENSLCQVCGGSGEVVVRSPVTPCAYCRGSGVHIHRRMVCTVCSGKGMVTVEKHMGTCPHCWGKGFRPGQYLPCLTCGGKGVIAEE